MKWRITLGLAAVSVALLVVLYRGFGRNPREVPFMLAGQPAPAFSLSALDGTEKVSLEQLRGRPVVINFWASWCEPCKMEHPVLEWGQREFGQRVQFLGIVFEDTEDGARDFLARFGASFPQLVDPLSGVAVDYGVAGVPETYFIDAQGIIRGKHVGPIDPQSLTARIRELLSDVPVQTTR